MERSGSSKIILSVILLAFQRTVLYNQQPPDILQSGINNDAKTSGISD